MDNLNLGPFLPWWLLSVPLVFALIDWARTPRSNADRHHSNMGAVDRHPVGMATEHRTRTVVGEPMTADQVRR